MNTGPIRRSGTRTVLPPCNRPYVVRAAAGPAHPRRRLSSKRFCCYSKGDENGPPGHDRDCLPRQHVDAPAGNRRCRGRSRSQRAASRRTPPIERFSLRSESMRTFRSLRIAALLVPCALWAQPAESNVIFGTYSGLALLMDVYKPASPNGYGIVVIPGSGWHTPLPYNANLLKQSKEFSVYRCICRS